jgi:glutamate 5-kinase
MASKLQAARIASWSGVRAVIASADDPAALPDAAHGRPVGTTFLPKPTRLAARKLWIAFAVSSAGTIVVDEGAGHALAHRGVSLLPAGVVSVAGAFVEGDAVDVVVSGSSRPLARGLVAVDAAVLGPHVGAHTSALPDGVPHEVIHRDDLVVLPR